MQKKQKFPYLVGSKWTAMQKMWGWRHFQVVNRKNQGKFIFAEMVAACDPNVRFWVNAKSLKDDAQWQAGWQSLQEREEESSRDRVSPSGTGKNLVLTKLISESPSDRLCALVSDPDDFI